MESNNTAIKKLPQLLATLFQKTKKLVLWIPVFTLLLGASFSIYLYRDLNERENNDLKAESARRSREIINQLDLLLSNSILRIQSYEEYIGTRSGDYSKDRGFLSQSLRYTIFQRFSIFKVMGVDKSSAPHMKLLARLDTSNSTLAPVKEKMISSEYLLLGIQKMVAGKEYSRVILHEVDGVSRLSLVLKSRVRDDVIFIFTAPLVSIFEKVDLRPGETIDITDPESRLSWTVSNSGEKRAIEQTSITLRAKGSSRHQYLFEGGLPQSGVKINFRFNFLEPEDRLSPALIASSMSILICLVVAYLFWVLVRQTRMVSRLVVEKTHDLEKTHQELQEALYGKTKFLGNISHEIRTPLNLILGMIDLCEERDKEKKLSEYLGSMRSSGNHLLSMIEDLLDLAKSDTNELQIQPKKMNLSQFLGEIAKLTGQDCFKKGLRFYTHFPAELPSVVVCDPSRLRQILLNLLKNACKYTNSGYVALRVKILSMPGAEKMTLRFEIEDTGVGIPQDKLGKVFEAFFQVESSYVFSEGGVGLGLAIVKELVRKLDGRINVQSKGKNGSIFEVDLDFEVPDQTSWIEAYKAGDEATRELVVMSMDPLVVESLSALSAHSQLKPTFQSYMEEPAASESFQKNKWYLLDSNLPNFSLDAAIRFSKIANVVVIGNRKALLDRKPDFSVPIIDSSPLLVSDVFIAVGLSLRKRFEKKDSQAVSANAVESIKDDLSVIVADDDLGNKELYMAYFEDKPWKTAYAMNGQEAYDLYLSTPSDVLVLDVRMPLMDGFEVAAKVRDYEQKHNLPIKPIILVTADALTETVDRAAKVPGVTFLTKPIRKSVLFDSIGKALNKS